MVARNALAQAAQQLKTRGARAHVPNADYMFVEAHQAWRADPTNPQNELDWRYASLIYGAVLGLQGYWSYARDAYGDPLFTEQVGMGCETFASLMAVGRAVSYWHLAQPEEAGLEAMGAIGCFSRVTARRYDPWRGVATLIQGVTKVHTARNVGAWTLDLLDRRLQPYTYDLAGYVSVRPGYFRTMRELLSEREVTIPATEGLYLFNELD